MKVISLPDRLGRAPIPPAPPPASSSAELAEALDRINSLATHSAHVFTSPLGPFDQEGETFWLPRYVFVGESAAEEAWRVAIYAGLDGTDARSTLAVLRTLERFVLEPALGHSFNLVFYPLINPSGWRDGTRRTRAGHLLSEQNWLRSPALELRLLERDARALQFHGVFVVRSEADIDDLHGWLRGFSPGEPFLHAEPVHGTSKAGYLPFKFPVHWEPNAEGLHAETGPLTLAEDWQGTPFEASLLVPASLPVKWAEQAVAHTLRVFLNNWRTSVATGQNI
jgi:hypothetical protein